MSGENIFPSREEALVLGLTLYGDVREVYVTPSGGEPTDELIGTKVSIKSVETDNTLLASTVEREYIRTNWGYRRAIRREIGHAANFMAGVSKSSLSS